MNFSYLLEGHMSNFFHVSIVEITWDVLYLKINDVCASKMAQWVEVLATKHDNLSSVHGEPTWREERTDSCGLSSYFHMVEWVS